MKFNNPIIPGFNPDPSICRVGDDYYLVTSSFEYFPGVPIYHSKNLVEWELISYCLTDDSQLELQGCGASCGIYAPTIRYYDGTFFMTTTSVTAKGIRNFIVYTKDITEKWSEPAWIAQKGIDPTLFKDDDGKYYFVSNGDGVGIGHYLCEIDPFSGEMLTESVKISSGCGGTATEAPHIYKRNGFYYLMVAEGGTEYGHSEVILRSSNIWGPYEPCERNPILTHRGIRSEIQATGHADLLEDANGNWWAVCLAIRPIRFLHTLGRETFLAPVKWDEDGWPIIGDNGRIALTMEGELPGKAKTVLPEDFSFRDEFMTEKLDLNWNFLRNPIRENYKLKKGEITLKGSKTTLDDCGGSPTMIAVRQQGFFIDASVNMSGEFAEGQISGITAFHNDKAHYDIVLTRENGEYYLCLRKSVFDIKIIAERKKLSYSGALRLRITSDKKEYSFFYEENGEWIMLGKGLFAALASETIYPVSFTGTFIGIFSENGDASFSSFEVLIKDNIQ